MQPRQVTRTFSPLALLILIGLPLILHLPALLGFVRMDPLPFVAQVGDNVAYRGGTPWIDPNVGFQAQALGKLSANQWLSGQVPWWNYYNGAGLPLAAEAQPASLFLPLVLLYHFTVGGIWVGVILQILAGLSTFALLRRLDLSMTASLAGALLYQLNGTFAWHGAPIFSPVAFLPLLLLAVEHFLAVITTGRRWGWIWVPPVIALSLYSGFPETAYINGLLVAIWVLARLPVLNRELQPRHLVTLAGAVFLGILLSLPQLVPFAEMVSLSDVGSHNGAFAHVRLPTASLAHSLMPWLFGPIFAVNDASNTISNDWGNVGGYFTALQVAFALIGLQMAPRKLTLALGAWMLLCLLKTFDVRPFSDIVNLIPLIKSAAFFRYSAPSWEFAGAVLVAFGIHGIQHAPMTKLRAIATFLLVLFAALLALHLAHDQVKTVLHARDFARMTRVALIWLPLSLMLGVAIMAASLFKNKNRARLAACLLAMDACLAFALPLRSGSRPLEPTMGGIAYLQSNIGLQRVYSMGPLAPNYGAYFGIAQINHNYLPVPSEWTNYIHAHLDPKTYEVVFHGQAFGDETEQFVDEQLRTRLPSYEELGVKYVVTKPQHNPFATSIQHSSDRLDIHDLQKGVELTTRWTLNNQPALLDINGITVLVGNYWNTSNGYLEVDVCDQNENCVHGRRSLAESANNQPFHVALQPSLAVKATGGSATLTLKLRQTDSTVPVNIWMSPVAQNSTAQSLQVDAMPASVAPIIALDLGSQSPGAISKVYGGPEMDIYQLPNPKPYFEPSDARCRINAIDRETVDVDCPAPASLLRREAYYPGWSARLNDAPVVIERARELFQSVTLPAGAHRITFRYRPSHLLPTMLAFSVAVIFWLISFGLQLVHGRRHRLLPAQG